MSKFCFGLSLEVGMGTSDLTIEILVKTISWHN